jgi:hypothetical protein
MRRPLVAAVLGLVAVAILPLAARAGSAPAITLTTPTANDVVEGELSITWTYRAFSRSAWVDVEASRAGEPFRRLARVRIDDGTPGYTGSATWAPTADDDGSDWTIRAIVPSNKQVQSSVFPVVVDNGGPEATEVERSPAPNAAGWNSGEVTVRWTCTDRATGVVSGEVTATASDEGAGQTVSATCTDLAGHSTTATASGINIDRTAPSVEVYATAKTNEHPSLGVFPTITGVAADALSMVTSVTVAFVDGAGVETRRQASCECSDEHAWWSVPTDGLTPGETYTITAYAEDRAGHTGASPPERYLIVVAPPTVGLPA